MQESAVTENAGPVNGGRRVIKQRQTYMTGIRETECPGWKIQIYKISYDNITIMPKSRSTYDGRLIYKTSYEAHKAFLGYDLPAKS